MAQFSAQLEQLQASRDGAVIESNLDHVGVSPTSPVTLNGCSSRFTQGPVTYVWTFSPGPAAVQPAPIRSTNCLVTWERPLSHAEFVIDVTLTLEPATGPTFSVRHPVRFRDVVIASLGDSAASGEGAPEDLGSTAAYRVSYECSRSGWAAKAQAALRAQQAMPETTIHFWDISCAGASITAAGSASPLDDGGMLTPFNGTYHTVNPPLVPQVNRLRSLQEQTRNAAGGLPTGLPIDRLLLTVGANDTNWARLGKRCMYAALINLFTGLPGQEGCLMNGLPGMRRALASLPGRFESLRPTLEGLTPRSNIYLSEYYDPLDSLSPQPLLCFPELAAGAFLRSWAVAEVERPLQAVVSRKASKFGWNFTGGNLRAFQGHGMCHVKGTRWVNTHGDSGDDQNDDTGTWHPNRAGQLAMADIAYRSFVPGLAARVGRR